MVNHFFHNMLVMSTCDHSYYGSSLLLSDDDDVLDEDELDDALPGFPLFGDGGLSCRTLAEKKLVANAMEPNQNLLLLGVDGASKAFSGSLLTNL